MPALREPSASLSTRGCERISIFPSRKLEETYVKFVKDGRVVDWTGCVASRVGCCTGSMCSCVVAVVGTSRTSSRCVNTGLRKG